MQKKNILVSEEKIMCMLFKGVCAKFHNGDLDEGEFSNDIYDKVFLNARQENLMHDVFFVVFM